MTLPTLGVITNERFLWSFVSEGSRTHHEQKGR